ncbi:MAG: hypothetical protein ACYSYW_06155 [Planctomycetota bacterium]
MRASRRMARARAIPPAHRSTNKATTGIGGRMQILPLWWHTRIRTGPTFGRLRMWTQHSREETETRFKHWISPQSISQDLRILCSAAGLLPVETHLVPAFPSTTLMMALRFSTVLMAAPGKTDYALLRSMRQH